VDILVEYPQMKSIIEGLLFVAGDEGLEAGQMAEVLEVTPIEVVDVLNELMTDFKTELRGIQIIEIAGAYQLTTLPEHAGYFQKLAVSPSRGTLSQAALETLAIVAYKQPITRIEIEEIRGVKSDRAIHTLVAKDLIKAVARADVVGRPILYGSTKSFLDYFGLNNINDLPDTEAFINHDNLEEETQMLFSKLDNMQMTIDELKEDKSDPVKVENSFPDNEADTDEEDNEKS
jgi:segregation and condensation protein B